MSQSCGLIIAEKNIQVPLKKICVEARIRGTIASLTTEFHYENKEENPIEAIFVLPLESGISVCEFKAEIDGRVIIGRVEEKEEARDIYDDAISSGQTAFLMEESRDSDDVFRISVGNLPPKKAAKVTVEAVITLKQKEDGELQFLLPTILNPRYSPSSSSIFDNWTQTSGVGVATVGKAYTFSFGADVECGSKITEVISPTHQLNVTTKDCHAKVDLKNIEKFEKDVEVIIRQEKPFEAFSFVEKGEESGSGFMSSAVVMLNYFPHDLLSRCKRSSPGDYIFVIDRSGSMSGGGIKNAREALVLFLKSLPQKSTFNIISFGSRFDKLYPEGSKPYTNENVSHACSIASTMQANYGGTEILQPLESLFLEKPSSDLQRRVFLITDGEVSNTSLVISRVKNECRSKDTRCFALGIGHGASTSLVKGVAEAGNGVAEFAREGATTQQKVISLLKCASQPCLSDITLSWNFPGSPTIRQIPGKIRRVMLGQPLIAFAEIKKSDDCQEGGQMKINFVIENTEKEVDLPVSLGLDSFGAFKAVHRCAAKALIAQLSESESSSSQNKSEIIELSKSSGVLSNLTAFVAVDEESSEVIKGAARIRTVPTMGSRFSSSMCFSHSAAFGGAPPLPGAPPPPGGLPLFGAPYLPQMQMQQAQGFGQPPPPPPPWGNSFQQMGMHAFDQAPPPPPPPGGSYPPAMAMPVFGQQASAAPPPPPSLFASSLPMNMNALAKPQGAPPRRQLGGATSPVSLGKKSSVKSLKEDRGGYFGKESSPISGTSSSSHVRLVSIQLVDGSWPLTSEVASELGIEVNIIEAKMPPYLKALTDAKNIWTTALVLIWLTSSRFSSVQLELELILEKAQDYLDNQFNSGVSRSELDKDAKAVFEEGKVSLI